MKEWENFKFKGTVETFYNIDTVGAVALDTSSNIAAATSTGGITGKKIGRVGDSPVIGSGAFADNKIAGVSATGHGESILKVMLSRDIIEKIRFGRSAEEAAKLSLEEMKKRVNGNGGVIIITNTGEVAYHFTTEKMAWAYIKNDELQFGI